VANTTQGLLQRFASAAAAGHDVAGRLAALVPCPWQEFRRGDLRLYLDRMVVSHKPDHGTRGVRGKTTGQLHNETAYGLVEPVGDDAWTVVVRKPLSALKIPGDLAAVRDPALRAALLELWERVKAEGGRPADFAERAAAEGVRLSGKVQRVRRVRVLDTQRVIPIKDHEGHPYKGYVPGGNEFAEVWCMPNGEWKLVVASTFDANQPGFNPAHLRPHPAAKRLARLHRDDMGALGHGQNRHVVQVRKITAARAGVYVVLDDHNEANVPARVGKDMKENRYSARQLKRHGFRKVGVDEIGRLIDPGSHVP